MPHAHSGPLLNSHWQPGTTAHPETSPGTAARISGTTIGTVLRAAAARAPDRTALAFGERWWTYADLLSEAEDGARALLARFMPGDVVAVWAENCPQWVALEFAAGLAGLTLAPINPDARADEVAYALAHSGARGIFLGTAPVPASGDSPDQAPGAAQSRAAIVRSVEHQLPALCCMISLREWDAVCAIGSLSLSLGPPETVSRLPEVNPDRPAQILYTSGTTGQPKAVLLTHRALTNNARLAMEAFGGKDGDTIVNPLPLAHVTGCGLMTLGTAQLTGTHVLMPWFDPAMQLDLAESHHCTLLGLEPTMLDAILTERSPQGRDLGSLRAVVSVGAPVPPDLALEAESALGVPVQTCLLQTESSGVITATAPQDTLADRLGGVGQPLPGTEVKITSLRTGQTAPCGEVGEIWVRGYQVMRGYLDDPRSTAAVLDDRGWLRTGDLGAIDTRGYCRIVGRIRELIVRGGQHIYPREIEAVLLSHPAVAEVAIVGVQDGLRGSAVAAIVRLSGPPDAPAATLTEFCGTRLCAYKVPVRWLFVNSFPRTAQGKVRKISLSTRLADATEPDWQAWGAQTPTDLGDTLSARHDDAVDLTRSIAELLNLRVPPQTPRSQSLEDIDL
jgi:fatty-acyl-CoA synthase